MDEPVPLVRKTRSVTLLKGNPKELKEVELEWDQFGQPIGDWQAKFANYVGLAARSCISILYDNWKMVEKKEKDFVWLDIKKYWRLEDDSSRVKVLKQANQSWSKFKQRLRRDFILQNKDPVPEYPYLDNVTWAQFVAKKTTVAFLEISRKARINSLMNKNPARLGPKGIRGRRSLWNKQKKAGKLPEVHNMKNERSKDFLLSRTIETAEGDIEVDTQFSQGLRVPEPGVDTIIVVRGKEHSGRLRGVGSYIGIKEGFTECTGKKRKNKSDEVLEKRAMILETQHEEKMRQMQVENEEYRKSLKLDFENYVQNYVNTIKEEMMSGIPVTRPEKKKSSCGSVSSFFEFDNIQSPTLCSLMVLHFVKNVVCASGRVYPIGNGNIHNVPLYEGFMKVSIDDVVSKYEDFLIPMPSDEISTLREALYDFIQWPRNAIVLVQDDKASPCEGPSTQLLSSIPKILPNLDLDQRVMKLKNPSNSNVNKKKDIIETIPDNILSMKPNILQSLYKRMQKQLQNQLQKQENVTYFVIYVNPGVFEEIIRMVNNKWLHVSVVTCFTIMLNSMLVKRCGANKSAFLNPNMITSKVCKDPERAISYVQRALELHKEKVFLLAPYWEGDHWALFIMWPQKNYVMILDSMKGRKTAASFAVTNIMQRAFTKNRIGADSQLKWLITNCNQQDGSWECGYYVMKWMFDFVMMKQQQFPQEKTRWNDLSPFSKRQLEEIVITWATMFNNEHPTDIPGN